ncbi:hypothetical protein [Streptomyces sp. YS-3]|uniref:hypothetical protein n=1 Tax=Streptomyces sp. YS-3 TaxID=3381352 RepID=UPI0038627B21
MSDVRWIAFTAHPSAVRESRGVSSVRYLSPLASAIAPTVLVASFVVQMAGVLTCDASLLVSSAVAGMGVDIALHHRRPNLVELLSRIGVDVWARQVLRDGLLLAVLFAACPHGPRTRVFAAVCGLLLTQGLQVIARGCAVAVQRSRTLPVVTRNIDVSALGLRRAPPAWLLYQRGPQLLLLATPGTAGMLIAVVYDVPGAALAGIAVSAALTVAAVGWLLLHLLPSRRPPGEQEVLAWFERWLADYRPPVGMYFSGGHASAYQADMWLAPLAILNERSVIVLRERFMVHQLGTTDLPVVCIPKAADLLRLEHSTLRLLIHPSNSGKTSHVLRIPTIRHAFVNHGESDKRSSCNPYARVYDQVWVAGPAARERYAQAGAGVDDKDIVEIGRPQLDSLRRPTGLPHRRHLTVLYAPTWEGWLDQPGATSLTRGGEELVQALLAEPEVRLLYKPHPLTGSVDPLARDADLRIRELVRKANSTPLLPGDAAAAAGRELAFRTAALDALTGADTARGSDDGERMRRDAGPVSGRAQAVRTATAAWEKAYWGALPACRHQVVEGTRPSLFSCFDAADVLVGDVSSVVADYLATGKSHAVVNTLGLSEDAFREAFPTSGAATILTAGAADVAGLLASVRGTAGDPLATARERLKGHLLGPDEPSASIRFQRAVSALAQAGVTASGSERCDTPVSLPTQRDAAVPEVPDLVRP